MKCPFCLNESYNVLSLVEVHTDDCVRVCVECSNCGLRGPGAEVDDDPMSLDDIKDVDSMAWDMFDEMAKVMGPVWNGKDWSKDE